MKKKKILISVLCIVVLIITSFFAGSHIQEQKHIDSRAQQCKTLLTFAIDKVENHDISDPGVMKALISNVYAAYEFCDDPVVADQLHGLWNILIFEDDDNNVMHDIARQELESALTALKKDN